MKCEAYLLLRAIGRFRFLQPTTTALHKYSEQVIGKYNHCINTQTIHKHGETP